jgi:Carboxypeptidase regulatory-like domain/TonB dependent receptor
MKKAAAFAAVVALLFVSSALAPRANAQAVYGSILGTVTDPQGAAVSGAKVTVTDQNKGTIQQTTTNDSGNYTVTHLIPDTYSVKVEAQGFKSAELKDIVVRVDNGSLADVALQLGSTTESVEVTSEAPQLKTDRADVSIEFDSRMVENLPNLNRNFTNLELSSPGTQKLSWGHAATENPQGSQQIFVQGQHFSGTAYELDGTDNQDPILGIIVVNPNLDAVTETKFSTQGYDAEFGKAVAGIITAQTKSGTNDVHGSAFWFRRTDATQAKDPFTQWDPGPASNPYPGSAVPPSRWQQFGGSIGGPVIKNKLFFFGDYQATRQSNGVTNQLTVPTARVVSTCNPATNASSATPGFCDLSDYIGVVAGGGQAYDPSTGSSNGNGGTRSAFGPGGACTGNCIPIGQVSPQAAAILALFPAPTTSGVLNNFLASGPGPFKQDSFDTRIDYALSSSMNVFGRFSLDYFKLSGKGVFGALGGPGTGLLGLAGSSITHNYSLATGVTKTISPTLITDIRFGWFKYNPQTQKPDGGTPMTDFGIPNANTSDPTTAGLGEFILGTDPVTGEGGAPTVGGGQGLSVSSFGDGLGVGRCNCPLTEREDQFQIVNNWTKTKGNHSIKFGADIRYARNLRIPSDNNRTGEYNFSPEATSNGGAGGLDLATFLLGDVTSLSRYVSNPSIPNINDAAERQKRLFFYGQDTYKMTSKLTFSYGLRWEIYTPESVLSKDHGGFANIEDNNGTGGIRVAGEGRYGLNGNIKNTLNAFAPRVGIAYQFTPKTVVRLGYGRSYDMGVFGSNFGHTVTQNLPVLVKQNVDASNAVVGSTASANYIPVFTLAQGPIAAPFPAIPSDGLITFPSLDQAGLGFLVTGAHIRPTKQILPTLDAWNVTVQHQLTNSISAEVAYVGNKGSHGFAGDGPSYDLNQKSMVLFGATDPLTGGAYPDQVRRPLCFPDLSTDTCRRIGDSLGNYLGNDASSNYNSFYTKVDKRFSQGLQFIAHYTFSRSRAYNNTYYPDSHPIAYGPNDFTRNHVFVISTVYELPFGRGKTFLNHAGRGVDYVVGGWQLTNNTNWSSGLPWTPTTNECGGEQDVGVCRPNKGSGSFHTGPGSFDKTSHTVTFFTPLTSLGGPFTDAGFGNLGNIGYNSMRGPSGFYSDLSVMKNIPITERVKAQFRMDASNIFNHPVYAFSGNNGANPCVDCQGGNNGKITDIEAGTTMRQLQFALRFNF